MFKRITQAVSLASIVGFSQSVLAQTQTDRFDYPEIKYINQEITGEDIELLDEYDVPHLISLIENSDYPPSLKELYLNRLRKPGSLPDSDDIPPSLKNLYQSLQGYSTPLTDHDRVNFDTIAMPFEIAYNNQYQKNRVKSAPTNPNTLEEKVDQNPNIQTPASLNGNKQQEPLSDEEYQANLNLAFNKNDKVIAIISPDYDEDGQTSLDSLIKLREYYHTDIHPEIRPYIYDSFLSMIHDITGLGRNTRKENPDWADITPEQRLEQYFPDEESRDYIQQFILDFLLDENVGDFTKNRAGNVVNHLLTGTYRETGLDIYRDISTRESIIGILDDYFYEDPDNPQEKKPYILINDLIDAAHR